MFDDTDDNNECNEHIEDNEGCAGESDNESDYNLYTELLDQWHRDVRSLHCDKNELKDGIKQVADDIRKEAAAAAAAAELAKGGSLNVFDRSADLRTPEGISRVNRNLKEMGSDFRVRATFQENSHWGTMVKQLDGTTTIIPSNSLSNVELYSRSTGVAIKSRAYTIAL